MTIQKQKPSIIVTGSSGLIGRAVIHEFKVDDQAIGFDRDGHPQPPPEVECVCDDLTDDESVRLGLDRARSADGPRIASVPR